MTLDETADRCLDLLHAGRALEATPLIAAVHAALLADVPPGADAQRAAWRISCAHFERVRENTGYRPAERLAGLHRAGFGETGYALLIDALARCAIASEEAESMCTEVREWVLAAGRLARGEDAAARLPELASALAIQGFFCEYMLAESPGEIAAVDLLEDDLLAAMTGGHAPATLDLALYGAYRPLHALAGAQRLPALVDGSGAALVQELIRCQVVEPLEEAALRPCIPALTSIADRTSQAVRVQYEENPYPRWRWIPASHAAAATPPGAAPAHERVLIAGCGTGRHPVVTAREQPRSSFLAVDLSLASLAYAARKIREYGILNVELAQADSAAAPHGARPRPQGRRLHRIGAAGLRGGDAPAHRARNSAYTRRNPDVPPDDLVARR